MTRFESSQGICPAGNEDAWPIGLEALAEAALPDFLLKQRWYPAKDAGRPVVRLAALVPLEDSPVPAAAAIWETTPPDRRALFMFVPLALTLADSSEAQQVIAPLPPEHNLAGFTLVEATGSDEFIRAWIGLLFAKQRPQSQLRGHYTSHLAASLGPSDKWVLHRSGAEQSNTSIRIGDKAILKVIRKIEEGIHPELEVSGFLSAAGFPAMPQLLGWIELDGGSQQDTKTLSILQAFVPNQGDGWNWLLERLHPQEEDALKETIAWLRQLAVRTAEMHEAFAKPSEDPAFGPLDLTEEDIADLRDAVHMIARRACDELSASREQLAPLARDLADQLTAQRGHIIDRVDHLLPLPGSFVRTRHHGDFHLGQVLVTGSDATIIDFEGEPLRPLAERRAKHAALRDVAGLLRSLSYAAATALRNLPIPNRVAVEPRMIEWGEQASQAFLDAYLEAARGAPGLPISPVQTTNVVRLFMLEKAFYEILYELANRPDWVEVPLRGALKLLDGKAVSPRFAHSMPFGAELQSNSSVHFRLWAPPHATVRLEVGDVPELLPMHAEADGWHEVTTSRARGFALSVRFARRDTCIRPGFAFSAGGRWRPERSLRSGRLPLDQPRLARSNLGRGGDLRTSRWRLYPARNISRCNRQT